VLVISEGLYWQGSALPWQGPLFARLCALAGDGRLPHALLLTGPKGAGKSRLAAAMASWLLCRSPGAEGACGQCESCALTRGGSHGDLRWLAPEESKRAIGIDAVRGVVGFMQQTPGYGNYKVLVIEPAEAMTIAAANALLKTLEEPPGQAAIIMISNRPGELPATVRSRCSMTAVPLPAEADALRWLVQVSGCEEVMAEQALVLAGGQPVLGAEMLAEGTEARIALATLLARCATGEAVDDAELRQAFEKFDVEAALETSILCIERVLRKSPGSPRAQSLFRQRDQLMAWLSGVRRGINFGREPILNEMVRLLGRSA